MYLVMGITGKVGGATARHLLKQGNTFINVVNVQVESAQKDVSGLEKAAVARMPDQRQPGWDCPGWRR